MTAPRWMRMRGQEKVERVQLEHCRYPHGIKRINDRKKAFEKSREVVCTTRRLVRKVLQAFCLLLFILVTGENSVEAPSGPAACQGAVLACLAAS